MDMRMSSTIFFAPFKPSNALWPLKHHSPQKVFSPIGALQY
uniref:Uncharacterized protein n=1 Tax=Lepeophtheirus salmonis TaxID=72036 RepID=A0A0K2T9E0_LEPSM